MKYLRLGLRVGLLLAAIVMALGLNPALGLADQTPSLSFREIKITDTEFVVLQNNGASPIQLNDYWLGYSSSDQAASIVPSQQLPSSILNPGEAILLTNDAADTCDATIVSKLGFSSLSDTKGTLIIRYLQNNGQTSTFTTVDTVNWSKPSASGSTTDNIDLRKESGLTTPVWYRASDSSTWQVGDYRDCSLALAPSAGGPLATEPQTVTWPEPIGFVPGTIVSLATATTGASSGPSLPAADRGLAPPQLSEILPDPAPPKTDANDEFIELYNPNSREFDLSGFTLQVGSTTSATRHNYIFPAGTKLTANGFKAFFASQTGLSLNNTGGQAWLLDPFGTVVSKTDPYLKPKDGLAWATVGGKWYFTVTPTPGQSNKISEPAASTVKTSNSVARTTQGVPVTAAAASNAVAKSAKSAFSSDSNQPKSSIHPLTLAVVIGLGLLYGAYEYRHDLANRFHQFRANRTTRS